MQKVANSDKDKAIIDLAKAYTVKRDFDRLQSLAEKLIDEGHLLGYYIMIKIMVFNRRPYSDTISRVGGMFNTLTISSEQYCKEVEFILNFLNGPHRSLLDQGPPDEDMYYYSVEDGKLSRRELPRHFSWVVAGKVAGSSIPKGNDIGVFKDMGIANVITCLEEPLQYGSSINGIAVYHIKINDRAPPTLEQMDQLTGIIESGPTVVHSLGGAGRANTVLACYLKKIYGRDAGESIETLKKLRQNVQLSPSQVEFIRGYSNIYHKLNNICDHQSQMNGGKFKGVKLPKLIICVGYPASGKTTFSGHFMKYYSDVIRVNQDEQTRSGCIDLFKKSVRGSKTILVDGCNITKEKRKEWIDLAFKPKAWCIWFDTAFEECKYRITRRQHPTIKGNGATILGSLCGKLVPPSIEEGFERVHRVSRNSELTLLLRDFGINEEINLDSLIGDHERITKFPRTKHLINFGSASRDDLLCTVGEQKMFINEARRMNVVIEEKVDGANLGISIGQDYKVRVQNRSHYVNSSYHPQFKLLDKWIGKHTSDLISILEPEIDILYGEWLYMKHSIHYIRLPDYFLAFDIYSVKNGTFLSRDKVTDRLKNTSIKQVPKLPTHSGGSQCRVENLKDFEALMKLQSSFYDGLLEVVYIRICDSNLTLHRAKIVRGDFICGSQHWSKNDATVNLLSNRII
jgi:atypical dual specificity phosphatase